MRFVVDAQLPPALAQILVAADHHAVHVADVALRDADDVLVWQYALENQAVIITKDEDFAARALRSARAGWPVVVWLRVGNSSRRALLEWFPPMLPRILSLIQQGERLIELRRASTLT